MRTEAELMKVNMTKKRLTVVVATAIALMVGGGVAYAYWTSTGTGTGTATTGTSTDFSITVDPPTGPPLTPGGPEVQTVGYTITNGATSSQMLNSVVATVAGPDGAPWADVPGCSADDYTVSPDITPAIEIAAGNSFIGELTITMNDLPTNQDACKDATVPLYILAS